MGKPKLCKNCGKPFNALTKRYLYCIKCRKSYYYKPKPLQVKKCLKCEKSFVSRRKVQKFCSVKCKDEHHKKSIVKIKVCKECKKEFNCTNDSQLYCDSNCYTKAKRRRDNNFYKEKRKNELSRSIKK